MITIKTENVISCKRNVDLPKMKTFPTFTKDYSVASATCAEERYRKGTVPLLQKITLLQWLKGFQVIKTPNFP